MDAGGAERYSFTRAELIDALARIEVRPVGGLVVADWMADAIIEALGFDDGGGSAA